MGTRWPTPSSEQLWQLARNLRDPAYQLWLLSYSGGERHWTLTGDSRHSLLHFPASCLWFCPKCIWPHGLGRWEVDAMWKLTGATGKPSSTVGWDFLGCSCFVITPQETPQPCSATKPTVIASPSWTSVELYVGFSAFVYISHGQRLYITQVQHILSLHMMGE